YPHPASPGRDGGTRLAPRTATPRFTRWNPAWAARAGTPHPLESCLGRLGRCTSHVRILPGPPWQAHLTRWNPVCGFEPAQNVVRTRNPDSNMPIRSEASADGAAPGLDQVWNVCSA